MLAFTAVVSVAVGIFCGVAPLLALRMSELASAVREGDSRTGSGSGRRFGNGLVVAEIAVAFSLLVGAGLLVKNLVLLRSRDAGIQTERIVAFDVSPVGPRYKSDAQTLAFWRELYARLAHAPGVESVGMTSHLPMFDFGWNGEFQIEGGTPWDADSAPLVEYRWFYGDYLKTMGIRLLQGRMLDDRDHAGATTVLINHAMAEKFWPGKDPIGKRFGQGKDLSKWYEVVGVLSDVRSLGLGAQHPVRVLPHGRGVGLQRRRDDRGHPHPRRRSDGDRPDGAADRRVDRSGAAAEPGPDDGARGERVGGTAAADVGADGAVRRAGGAAGDGRRLRRDGLQRPRPAARVRDPHRARRGSSRGCATSWSAAG